MTTETEIRIKLSQTVHQKWQNAATLRGLTIKGFVAATVSAELIRTGELQLTPLGATHAEPSGAPAASPVEDKPKWQVRFDNMDAEDAIAYRDQVAYWLSEDQVPEDRLDTIRAELAYLETLHGTASGSVGDWMLDD